MTSNVAFAPEIDPSRAIGEIFPRKRPLPTSRSLPTDIVGKANPVRIDGARVNAVQIGVEQFADSVEAASSELAADALRRAVLDLRGSSVRRGYRANLFVQR